VYAGGRAARRGVSLHRFAEADAIAKEAASIQIDASLAAVDFHRALVRRPPGRGDPSDVTVIVRSTIPPLVRSESRDHRIAPESAARRRTRFSA